MNRQARDVLVWAALAAMLTTLIVGTNLRAQKRNGQLTRNDDKKATRVSATWTLEQVREQLRVEPNDSYLQYVALQLARRQKQFVETAKEIEELIARGRGQRDWGRSADVDLLSMFTGALAVQESLQLDTMRGEPSRRPRRRLESRLPAESAPTKEPDKHFAQGFVDIATLTGPTIKSHPWAAMLAGKKPAVSPLAKAVPENFYFVEFRKPTKLLEAIDHVDLWGAHLYHQSFQEARTQNVGDCLKNQLAIETNKLLQPFYDLVVDEVAVTGSDLFVREGSDVTLLFQFKEPEVFKARMDGFLTNAEKAHRDSKRSTGTMLGVDYVHIGTPDGLVHVYSAYPRPNLHVRSNSLVAFERILEALQGETSDGKAVRRLGDSDEFAYIRTLMPRGAAEEDGFVYLSDPFIRHMVGPRLKLTERRRLLAFNHLKMIGHAAMLYRNEHGKRPASLQDLERADCTPGKFNEGILTCPFGGKYSLSADGTTGVNSLLGTVHSLKPCCEIPLVQVSSDEALEFNDFLQEYNQYWRTYFDPIAIRLQITLKSYRLETIVLPLIDNTIYTVLSRSLGGKPEPLDSLPVPEKNIFSLNFRLNKQVLAKSVGLGSVEVPDATDDKSSALVATRQTERNLKQIALAVINYTDSHSHNLPTVANYDVQGRPLLSWRVHILPFLDQTKLYKEFHLDEPWDSEHNKKLISRMPAVFRCPASKAEAGKTTYLAPVGKDTIFSNGPKDLRFPASIRDGISNTVLFVDANDGQAVVWTKPEDLAYDARRPLNGLVGHYKTGFVAVLADGSAAFVKETVDPRNLHALFSRAGNDPINYGAGHIELERFNEQPNSMFGFLSNEDSKKIKEFVAKGLGNQYGLHVYDASPQFDFNLSGYLAMMMNDVTGGFVDNSQYLSIGFMIAALNAPIYAALPVHDAKIVDQFLDFLDKRLAVLSRQRESISFLRLEHDFYTLSSAAPMKIRSYGLQFGPIKWRFFWARIGDGLYIANKRFILDDLAKMAALPRADPNNAEAKGPVGHAIVRIRAQNWNRVLDDYRLSWAENNRRACLNNLSPMSNVARSLATGESAAVSWDDRSRKVQREAETLYAVHFFCPDSGSYVLAPDSKSMVCRVHGSWQVPKQASEPNEKSPFNKMIREFGGMTATLTFMEDGLRAVVTIERK